MKRKRNFIISGVLIVLAGFFSLVAWATYREPTSVATMVLASVLFMVAVVIFAFNFKE
ncbi:MAG: hypothetical protein V4541_00745 [Bacteroidota bacterium]